MLYVGSEQMPPHGWVKNEGHTHWHEHDDGSDEFCVGPGVGKKITP